MCLGFFPCEKGFDYSLGYLFNYMLLNDHMYRSLVQITYVYNVFFIYIDIVHIKASLTISKFLLSAQDACFQSLIPTLIKTHTILSSTRSYQHTHLTVLHNQKPLEFHLQSLMNLFT